MSWFLKRTVHGQTAQAPEGEGEGEVMPKITKCTELALAGCVEQSFSNYLTKHQCTVPLGGEGSPPPPLHR